MIPLNDFVEHVLGSLGYANGRAFLLRVKNKLLLDSFAYFGVI